MKINLQKEEFSYAYIRAVATVVGCVCERTTTPLDQLGVDLIITGLKSPQLQNFPILYAQVKCTSRDVFSNNLIRYPLPIKNYNELSIINRYPAIILIVVIVPKQVNELLQQTEASLCLKRCGYWLSLEGAATTENRESITVSIPRNNLFTPTKLEFIMQKKIRGERL
ncbi:MAG: DUF4365 domain-containing protein [Okeania sp. SIO2D1]|nr:DUF4365 domain-containing protein [Okeania sp. SIO2D1]